MFLSKTGVVQLWASMVGHVFSVKDGVVLVNVLLLYFCDDTPRACCCRRGANEGRLYFPTRIVIFRG